MVCTDAAARGIDIPFVTHVVQADFATDAIVYLHRVSQQPCRPFLSHNDRRSPWPCRAIGPVVSATAVCCVTQHQLVVDL